MPKSVCPKCDSASFEAQAKTLPTHKFKLTFIQCSGCGCVVGVLPHLDPVQVMEEIEKKIRDVQNRLQKVEKVVKAIYSQG